MKHLNKFPYFEDDLRKNCKKGRWKNDGFRSIFESTIHKYVYQTLEDWKEEVPNDKYVLIGGLAYSYYLKPRETYDIDLIFLTYNDIPTEVYKFRKHRKHAFEHIKTNVEVEVITPEHIGGSKDLFEKIFETSIVSEGVRVASPMGLIAMKLGRFNDTDQLDIKKLYKYCLENDMDTDISIFNLDKELVDKFNKAVSSIDEKVHNNMYLLEVCSMMREDKYVKIKDDKLPFDIYVFEDNYGEPRFNIGTGFDRWVKKIDDYMFSISLTDTYKNDGHLKVLESSTDYPSFNMFEHIEKMLKEWLGTDNNLEMVKNKWQSINSRHI